MTKRSNQDQVINFIDTVPRKKHRPIRDDTTISSAMSISDRFHSIKETQRNWIIILAHLMIIIQNYAAICYNSPAFAQHNLIFRKKIPASLKIRIKLK